MDKKVKVAVIGCGGRSQYVVGNLLRDSSRNVSVETVFDPDRSQCELAMRKWDTPHARICQSCREAIDAPGVEWVMVFSPNAFHKEHVLAGFAAGKNVFSEKPMATTIEDCQQIYLAHQAAKVLFATGFVLRYSKLYRKAKEILDSGRLGKLYAINADENIPPEHGTYIMCNWRRLKKYAGPHILEKCCHDLDLINWFCGSLPSKVASFANSKMFLPENQFLMDKYGREKFKAPSWVDPHAVDSPFTSDKDILDNQTAIARFRNGVLATFQCTMCNTLPERRMYFSCTEGTMRLDLRGELLYRNIGEDFTHAYDFGADGHGGGDDYIMKELYDTMCNGNAPKCSGNEGLESAVYALACEKAALEGKVVDLEPIWEKLGR